MAVVVVLFCEGGSAVFCACSSSSSSSSGLDGISAYRVLVLVFIDSRIFSVFLKKMCRFLLFLPPR